MKPIRTLLELKNLAMVDKRYKDLLIRASQNLGGPAGNDVNAHYRNLVNNATAEPECSEEGVVEEVNALL